MHCDIEKTLIFKIMIIMLHNNVTGKSGASPKDIFWKRSTRSADITISLSLHYHCVKK